MTGLWLKGLPLLRPSNVVSGREPRVHRMPPGPNRWRERSRTFPGIAAAMAEQWGCLPVVPRSFYMEGEAMTQSKHTPGPWEVDDASGEGAVGVFDENGQRICYMSEDAMAPDGLRSRAEDDANARLIAAAPEMLAWILEAEHRRSCHVKFSRRSEACTCGREAAIRKATGGEG